jgi:mono/diheme cytochrome c family protein
MVTFRQRLTRYSLRAALAGGVGAVAGALLLASGAVGAADNAPPPSSAVGSPQEWQQFLDGNCIACHSERAKAGGLVLEGAALTPIAERADVWEKVIRKVGAGEMPPPSVSRRPDAHQSAAFIAWLTRTLDEHAAARPDPGRPIVRRLTRVEYSNAIRDILEIDVRPGDQLPPDAVSNGFNNGGEALSLSPLLLEKYMQSARYVTRAAVGDPTLPRTIYAFATPERQEAWRAGLPFGARGMPATEHYFPVDGDYVLRVFTDFYGDGGRLADREGVRFFQQRVTLKAGPHRVAAMLPEEGAAAHGIIPNSAGWGGNLGGPLDPRGSATRLPVLDIRVDGKLVGRHEIKAPTDEELRTPATVSLGAPWLRRLEIDGPYGAKSVGSTQSRARIFICTPTAPRQEAGCAQRIVSAVARRAFRREVASRDLAPFMAIYNGARADSGFEASVQQALQAVLVSPSFLFRTERDPPRARPGQTYALNDYELATRLSFFLWSSIPDDRLLDLAKAGQLKKEAVLERETRRMLADPKAEALVDNFGMQLLGLQDLAGFTPDRTVYPNFSTTLRDDMGEEAKLFARDVMLGNRSVIDLIGADYSYLNDRLAEHYGIKGVRGAAFRKVEFGPNDPRGGVLGMGAVLMVTSHQNITSPVLRGKWVLASLLNQPPSPPPPGIPALVPTGAAGRKLTGREQMEQHRTNPVCSSCHARMDPFGFALENFDVTGRWRDKDEAGPVNAAVSMSDGINFDGPTGLKRRLVARQDEFARAVTEKLTIYALGRRLGGADGPMVRQVTASTKAEGYRFEDLVMGVVRSPQFRMRRKANNDEL